MWLLLAASCCHWLSNHWKWTICCSLLPSSLTMTTSYRWPSYRLSNWKFKDRLVEFKASRNPNCCSESAKMPPKGKGKKKVEEDDDDWEALLDQEISKNEANKPPPPPPEPEPEPDKEVWSSCVFLGLLNSYHKQFRSSSLVCLSSFQPLHTHITFPSHKFNAAYWLQL